MLISNYRSKLVIMSLSILIVIFQNCHHRSSLNSTAESENQSPIAQMSEQTKSVARVSNNVYSPNLIFQGGTTIMYYGGWDNSGQIHDNIYRANCPNEVAPCGNGALIMDSAALGFEHLNDPSVVVLSQQSFLMYMTGVPAGLSGLVLKNNQVFFATSTDAIHWSQPILIGSDIWLPSATVDNSGNVLLYGNGNGRTGDYMIQYNLGPTGKIIQQRQTVTAPKAYANVEVKWNSTSGLYQILGEVNQSGPNQIDYLTSTDGIKWTLGIDGVVKPTEGAIYVRTPAIHPNDESLIYYAQTANPNNTANKILVDRWDVPPTACSNVRQTPVNCAPYAGQYGIPAGATAGNASWTKNNCTGAIAYTGGCSAPVCTDEPQTPVTCAPYAGQYGIPAGATAGNASWTKNNCTGAIAYTGGCSAPVCADVPQTPVACAPYAGQYGIPAEATAGNASWIKNNCTGAIAYTGGCRQPEGRSI